MIPKKWVPVLGQDHAQTKENATSVMDHTLPQTRDIVPDVSDVLESDPAAHVSAPLARPATHCLVEASRCDVVGQCPQRTRDKAAARQHGHELPKQRATDAPAFDCI